MNGGTVQNAVHCQLPGTAAPQELSVLFTYVSDVCDPVETKLQPQSGLHPVHPQDHGIESRPSL